MNSTNNQITEFEKAKILNSLNEEQLEDFNERAAIIEFDGGYSREISEAMALRGIVSKYSGSLDAQISAMVKL